jgi:hypothetical protein
MGIARIPLQLTSLGIATILFIYIIIMGIARIPLPLIVSESIPFCLYMYIYIIIMGIARIP